MKIETKFNVGQMIHVNVYCDKKIHAVPCQIVGIQFGDAVLNDKGYNKTHFLYLCENINGMVYSVTEKQLEKANQ